MAYGKLLVEVENARRSGKSIGLVQGSWDLFHLGHLKYIKEARNHCDYLIIAMDSDEKIRSRKGAGRPIIPEQERREFLELLKIGDYVVTKPVDEKKWGLIKTVKPDVLIAIKENYSDEQIEKLKDYCGTVKILPRQSTSSTSDKIRRATIAGQMGKIDGLYERVSASVEEMKRRIHFSTEMPQPIPEMFNHLTDSTDWVCPVVASCFWNGRWYFGANHSNFSIPKYDIENRTELYYATAEHAEMNLLKQLGDIKVLDTPIWTTLFPCDKCMKVLIDKGVREIYYLEDHPNRNWSKRSHELARKHGVKTINLLDNTNNKIEAQEIPNYKYIFPPNARTQEQLDIMMRNEYSGLDPFDPKIIDQEILFKTDYWYITENRFAYEGVAKHYLIFSLNPIYNIDDITKEMWNELKCIWLKLKNEYNAPGGALCFRYGDPALSGASGKRLHCHVIVPQEDQKIKFTIGGKRRLKRELRIKTISELR